MRTSDVTRGGKITWQKTADTQVATITLKSPSHVQAVDLQESIEHGQSVNSWRVEGKTEKEWITFAGGTTIGYRALNQMNKSDALLSQLRLTIKSMPGEPPKVTIRAYSLY